MVRDHLDFTLGQRNGTSNSPKWRNCFTTKSSNRQMDGNHNMSDRLLPTTKCPLQEFLFLMLIIWESSFILWQSLKSSLFLLSFFQIVESLKLPNRKSVLLASGENDCIKANTSYYDDSKQPVVPRPMVQTSSVKQRCFPRFRGLILIWKRWTSMDFDVPQSFEGPRRLSFWGMMSPDFTTLVSSQCSKCQPFRNPIDFDAGSREAWLGQGGEVYEECHRLPSSPCLKILKVQHIDMFLWVKFSSQTDFYQWSMSSFYQAPKAAFWSITKLSIPVQGLWGQCTLRGAVCIFFWSCGTMNTHNSQF